MLIFFLNTVSTIHAIQYHKNCVQNFPSKVYPLYHFFPCCGPCNNFSNSSLRIWLVLFCASTLFLWVCLSYSCCSLSCFSMSLIFSSKSLTWSSSYLVCVLKLFILFSISFFFCSACKALLIPKAIDDSYKVWYDWIVCNKSNNYRSDFISHSHQ